MGRMPTQGVLLPCPRHAFPGPRVWLLAHRGIQPQHAGHRRGRRSHHLGALRCAWPCRLGCCRLGPTPVTCCMVQGGSGRSVQLQMASCRCPPTHLSTPPRAGMHAARWGMATARRRASRSVWRGWRQCRYGRQLSAAGTCWRWTPRGSAGPGVSAHCYNTDRLGWLVQRRGRCAARDSLQLQELVSLLILCLLPPLPRWQRVWPVPGARRQGCAAASALPEWHQREAGGGRWHALIGTDRGRAGAACRTARSWLRML